MMELESLIINPAAQGTSARKKSFEKTRIAGFGPSSSKNNSKPRLEGERKGAGFYLPVASFDPFEVTENSNLADKPYQDEEGGVDDDDESYRPRNSDSYRPRNSDSDSSDEEEDHRGPQHRRHLLTSTSATTKSSLSHLFTIISNSILPSNEMATTPPEAETMSKDQNALYFDGEVASVDPDAVKLAGLYSEFLLIPFALILLLYPFIFFFSPSDTDTKGMKRQSHLFLT